MKESQNVEWKESWRDEYLKWICGFANAQGGVLEIGRNDRGEVVGVRDVLRLLEEIPNKAQSSLGVMVDVNLKEESGREYLQVVVEPYPNPISYKGEFHYRTGSTRQVLRGAALSHVGRRTATRRTTQGPGWTDAGGVPAACRCERAAGRGHPRRVRRRGDREAPPAGARILEACRCAAVPPVAGQLRQGRIRQAWLFPRCRVAVPGRDRRKSIRTGRPHDGSALLQVFTRADSLQGRLSRRDVSGAARSNARGGDQRRDPSRLRRSCAHSDSRVRGPDHVVESWAFAGGLVGGATDRGARFETLQSRSRLCVL